MKFPPRFFLVVAVLLAATAGLANAQTNWQAEWDKTVRAAESEGQLTLYGCCYDYDRVLEVFKKKYPKLKVSTVLSGGQLAARILAERRGEKYLVDVVSSGANTLHDALHKAHALDPIKPALLLPEVVDQSKWYDGEHRYIDTERRYIFAFNANSQSGQITYNLKQVNPGEFKSYWDLLNSKWKGKLLSLDPTSFGMGTTLQFYYHHPELGPPYLKKLYGEMQITTGRDPRQMTDWLSTGKFPVCIRCNAGSEIGKAVQQQLPIGYFDTDEWKEGGSLSAAEARSASQRAPRIPTPPRFLSTGCCPAKDRSRCRNWGAPTRTTHGVSISPRTTSIQPIVWSQEENISIWPNPSTRI